MNNLYGYKMIRPEFHGQLELKPLTWKQKLNNLWFDVKQILLYGTSAFFLMVAFALITKVIGSL